MIPHKSSRGAAALKRLELYEGVPPAQDRVKKMVVPAALRVLRLKPGRKYCTVKRISAEVGWNYKDVVDRLEEKRKVKGQAYFERKVGFWFFWLSFFTLRLVVICVLTMDASTASRSQAPCQGRGFCSQGRQARRVRLLGVAHGWFGLEFMHIDTKKNSTFSPLWIELRDTKLLTVSIDYLFFLILR